jgi:uncharacterized protein with FMN-binding domain
MNKKVIIIIICVILVGAAAFGGTYFYRFTKYKQIVSDINIATIDLSGIPDGTYTGAFDAIFVSAGVTVTVANNQITNIILNEHFNDRGQTAEVITDAVLSAQSLDVDTISGATNSSMVILKAIENALNADTVSGATTK